VNGNTFLKAKVCSKEFKKDFSPILPVLHYKAKVRTEKKMKLKTERTISADMRTHTSV
jgi:hypothetical protein